MLRAAVAFAAITVPLQILAGDMHGLNTLEHQPLKVAAMEAHWHAAEPGAGVPLVVFAWPDADAETNRHAVEIPRLGSLILTHEWDGDIPPLTSVPREERPPVAPVFFAFRVMVGIGLLMLVLAWASALTWWRGGLFEHRWLLVAWNVMLPSGFVALIAGWFVTEIGRQPWVVQGLMRTSEAVGEQSAGMVLASLATYVVGYAFVFGFGVWYLTRLVRRWPVPDGDGPDLDGGDRTPARPISAAGIPGED